MDLRKPTLDQQIATLLDVDQAARVLAVHPATLYRWARAKRVPSIRIGAKLLRFDPRALEGFIARSSSVEAPSPR